MSHAIAYLDESGDAGRDRRPGSSPLFITGLVVFVDPDEAHRCDERIGRLRTELGKPERYEFRFRDNPDPVRRTFLAAVAPFSFTYHAAVLEKGRPGSAWGEMLYIDACARVCALAGEALNQAHLIADASSHDRHSQQGIATRLRNRINTGRAVLADVRMQDSARHNLIQLADYITGVTSWHEQKKRGGEEYYHLLRARRGKLWRGPA